MTPDSPKTDRLRRVCRKGAITLVEVLVTLAIIVVVCAILFPVIARTKEQAVKSKVVQYGKQIGTSVLLYAADHDDLLPYADSEVTLWIGLPVARRGVSDCITPVYGKEILFHPYPNAQTTPGFEGRWGRPMSTWAKYNERIALRRIRLTGIEQPSRTTMLMNLETRRPDLIGNANYRPAGLKYTTIWVDGSVRLATWEEVHTGL